MSSLTHSTTNSIEQNTINWKKKYEKEKKEKNKLTKQIENCKLKLKKATTEIEKASNYYRKQMEMFKNKQTELLTHISSTDFSSPTQDIKYVFVEDINKIKILNKNRNNCGSIEIYFING
eukprot:25618_1